MNESFIISGRQETMPFRGILQQISRGKTFARRFTPEFGGQQVVVTPAASLRYWRPGLEHVDPESFDFIRRYIKPGHVLWDIGANVGTFTFAAAWKAGSSGKVFAFEPDVWIHSLLMKSMKLHEESGRAQIRPLCFAVSDKVGSEPFCITRKSRSTGHLKRMHSLQSYRLTGGVEQIIEVPVLTLDALLERYAAPDVVKIDVEGAEALALSGGERLLNSIRPVVYCEVKQGNREAVTEIFHQKKYNLFKLNREGGVESVDVAVRNTIALPETH